MQAWTEWIWEAGREERSPERCWSRNGRLLYKWCDWRGEPQSSSRPGGDTTMYRLLLLSALAATAASHGFLRGYSNSRSWGTGPQRRARTLGGLSRTGRQEGGDNSLEIVETVCRACRPDSVRGPVCGTDGATYPSQCALQRSACRAVRRQGESRFFQRCRSLQHRLAGRALHSSQLKVEVAHTGSCRAACPGMESLGQFQAFGSAATNAGEPNHSF